MKTLYVSRPLLNIDDISQWANEQGFGSIVDDIHVTIAFSKEPIKWPKPKTNTLINETKNRTIKQLEKGAIVLCFPSKILQKRWQHFMDLGATWGFPSYMSHISLTYKDFYDLESIQPYIGELEFGPEKFEEVDENWVDGIKELSLD
jgi:hypothetical protein